VAVDTKKYGEKDKVHIHGGRTPTEVSTLRWVKEVENRGAGEILLTSMDHDGTKNGFANALTSRISSMISIPVIASGGAGTMHHFVEAFDIGRADAALAASIFHFREIEIPDLKKYIASFGIPIRI
jgi:cyclase